MNKNKKTGFTLVELLAVIVILAIILAIAIPGITGIINSTTKGAFNSDAKMVLQAIEYKKLANEDFDPLEVTKENMSSTLGLSSANYEQVNISVTDGKTEVILVGTDKWDGFTAYGSIKDIRVVNTEDYDVAPPSITILGNNPANIGRGSVYTDAGAIATDLKDGDVTISSTVIKNASNVVVDSVDTTIFSTYTVIYTAIDNQGNKTSSIRRVNVVDRTKPVITVLGVNPFTINVNSVYSDAGATALDDTDGDITSSIITTGNVNPSVVGTYTMTYDVSDGSGNIATTVVRTINVVDVSAPVITILGNNPSTINVDSTYTDAGATALDDVDGDLTSRIVVTGTVNPSVIGTYTITYTVKDNANNQSVTTRTVNVIDNVAPTAAFGTNGNSTYAKTRNTTVTISDIHSSVNLSSLKYQWTTSTTAPTEASFSTTFTNGGTITSPAGVTGSYYLWILAKDTVGNTAIVKSNVFNLDNAIPIITLLGSNPASVAVGNTYTDAGATALDDATGNITGSIVIVNNVNKNVVGTYTVTYNVTDSSGNVATQVVRTVKVTGQVILTFTSTQSWTVPTGITSIDVFLVGGGGGGGFFSGAGGGYTKTYTAISVTPGNSYNITIGSGGAGGVYGINAPDGVYSRFGSDSTYQANGGLGGRGYAGGGAGGAGGSGGAGYSTAAGGSDGSNGGNGNYDGGGAGQGTTTKAFGSPTGTLYAGGGSSVNGTPGAGGGGSQGNHGTPNTGGGGGSGTGATNGNPGGSGIVLVRYIFN